MARSLKKGPFADEKTCPGIRYRGYGWTQTR